MEMIETLENFQGSKKERVLDFVPQVKLKEMVSFVEKFLIQLE